MVYILSSILSAWCKVPSAIFLVEKIRLGSKLSKQNFHLSRCYHDNIAHVRRVTSIAQRPA